VYLLPTHFIGYTATAILIQATCSISHMDLCRGFLTDLSPFPQVSKGIFPMSFRSSQSPFSFPKALWWLFPDSEALPDCILILLHCQSYPLTPVMLSELFPVSEPCHCCTLAGNLGFWGGGTCFKIIASTVTPSRDLRYTNTHCLPSFRAPPLSDIIVSLLSYMNTIRVGVSLAYLH
jgi:hypothetical protein